MKVRYDLIVEMNHEGRWKSKVWNGSKGHFEPHPEVFDNPREAKAWGLDNFGQTATMTRVEWELVYDDRR